MAKTKLTKHSNDTSSFGSFRMQKFEKRNIKCKQAFHNIKNYLIKVWLKAALSEYF